MFKVFTITIGSYLMKVGVCGENDSLPKSAGLVAVVFMVDDLDEAQSLARRLVNSMGNTYNHEVYMASDNGEILYVGMGKHGRHKHLQSGFSHVKEANEYSGELSVEVVHRGLSRRQASKYEAEMIAELSPTWNRVQPKVVEGIGDDRETLVEGFDIEEPKKVYRKVGKVCKKVKKPYEYNPEDHSELFRKLFEIGDGSLKSGDFARRAMEIIKEYSETQDSDFVEFVTNGDYIKKENPWKGNGKVVRRFLGNLGMVVETKRKMISGEAGEYSVLTTRDYIIAKTLSDDSVMDSDTTEQVKLAREIIQQMKIDE